MKKIFAIALALVMVLSMASAFATYCDAGWNWDCATTPFTCGKAKVEVVPFVRSSTACAGESTFVQSDCAAAVPKENIYYAVKLTVDADINQDWWDAATLNIKGTNLSTDFAYGLNKPLWKDTAGKDVAADGGVFWLTTAGATDASAITAYTGWEEENAAFTFGDKNVFKATAAKTSAKVCVTLASEWEVAWTTAGKTLKLGAWEVTFRLSGTGLKVIDFEKGSKTATVVLKADDKVDFINYAGKAWNGYSTTEANTFKATDGTTAGFACDPGAFIKEIFDVFGFNFETCLTDKGINANFGWDDEIKACTSYKTQGTAVVDAECVVAIPKTGDASVLAWLF